MISIIQDKTWCMDQLTQFENKPDSNLAQLYMVFLSPFANCIRRAGGLLIGYLRQLEYSQRIQLGNALRPCSYLEPKVNWTANQLKKYLGGEALFAAAAIGTFHPNGYFRMECLHIISRYQAQALPYVLIRCNDWVRAIRDCALQYTKTILPECKATTLLENLIYFWRLKYAQRRDIRDYQEIYTEYLKALLQNRESIHLEHIINLPRLERKAIYVFSRHILTVSDRLKLVEVDSYLCNYLVKELLKNDSISDMELQILLQHKNAQVRYLSLQYWYQERPQHWKLFENYLTDAKRTIRELSRFTVEKHRNINWRTYYQQKMIENLSVGAILGLAETGRQEDSQLLKPLLSQNNTQKIRKAALLGISMLCGLENERLYRFYFAKEELGLCSTAYRILKRAPMLREIQPYIAIYKKTRDTKKRQRIWVLISHGQGWDSLHAMLSLVGISTIEEKGWIGDFLNVRSIYSPCPAEKVKPLLHAWHNAKPCLTQSVMQSIQFLLHVFRLEEPQ